MIFGGFQVWPLTKNVSLVISHNIQPGQRLVLASVAGRAGSMVVRFRLLHLFGGKPRKWLITEKWMVGSRLFQPKNRVLSP
ncbi:hypothetical protein A2478_01175 [Candidatus Falkowbacteria bacterium RIFOXYC2_FULL_36_12]|uniref:Uncharacterized protein n=1 Tax=Candidatus Falkowbacteria bacterium RIFOXYC2_FULL_36_12 TaxID=1798002 RepID=A0A1F5T0Y7_9BACT|nr:MAG: hypothetical protein A2478_01175 [Candidatus Falkowbacteria bacterium RIFOXYC2_FULL_36_12]